MKNSENLQLTDHAAISKLVREFYNHLPYPPPIKNLDSYQKRWQEPSRRHADFHLFWPVESYRENLDILVAGCGTSQAARYALRHPGAQVFGIDNSETSIRHSCGLKKRYGLQNLKLEVLPLEKVEELGRRFDVIICTGVLHHLPSPEIGLTALQSVLKPSGAMHLMVYAPYGRTGIYMLQDFCRQLGIRPETSEIQDLAETLRFLPDDHPLQHRLRDSPDFQSEAGLADALLHPQDRAYSVPQLIEFIRRCGLTFGRWLRQAPYLPQCSPIAKSPFGSRIKILSPDQQFAAMELFRGTMVRHSLIVYRDKGPGYKSPVRFDVEGWQDLIPIRLPTTIVIQERLPKGANAVLINQAHTFTDVYLPIDQQERGWYDAIDGQKTITNILQETHPGSRPDVQYRAKDFFECLWHYDQVVFDASKINGPDRI
jgi:SAM-dependent methyltransferase